MVDIASPTSFIQSHERALCRRYSYNTILESTGKSESGQVDTRGATGSDLAVERPKMVLTMDIEQFIFQLLSRILNGSHVAEKQLMRCMRDNMLSSAMVKRVIRALVSAGGDNLYALRFLESVQKFANAALRGLIETTCQQLNRHDVLKLLRKPTPVFQVQNTVAARSENDNTLSPAIPGRSISCRRR